MSRENCSADSPESCSADSPGKPDKKEKLMRSYRVESEAHLHHVTLRGVSKQIIFEDDDDRRFMGGRIRRYLDELDSEIYAWCFMSNHIHLLLHIDVHTMAIFMNKLLVSYVRYFNEKTGRVGHLMQGRYDSVPIETDEQLMATVRYIHRNPEDVPGKSFATYYWSSYREYTGMPFITNTMPVMKLFSSLNEFVRFHEEWNPASSPPKNSRDAAPDDQEAALLACKLLEITSVSEIASLDKTDRDASLAVLKDAGLSVKQVARLTGLGRNIVQRAK